MEFSRVKDNRYSVRKFKDTPVDQALIDGLLEAGRIAPTAVNNQPQRVLVLNGKEDMERLDICTACHYGAPLALVVCYDADKEWVREDGARSGQIDASVVTTYMMLEATELGLGTVWVMIFEPDKLRAEFGIPDNLHPVAILMAGYPADGATPAKQHTERNAVEDMVMYHQF